MATPAVHNRPSAEGLRRLLGTRRGALVAAAVAAALAGVLLLVYVREYKNNVQNGTQSVSVLIADRLIPAGTAGSELAKGGFFRPVTVAADKLKPGAISDAGTLAASVATHDIYPGQQVGSADFAAGADALRSKIANDQRALSITLDGSHGLLGNVRAGDHVDILAGFSDGGAAGRPIVREILRDIVILSAPGPGVASGAVVVRVNDKQASELAFAADNSKLWFALRPPVGARDGQTGTVDLSTLLQNTGSGR
jgi:pilus assembly protein CpaB